MNGHDTSIKPWVIFVILRKGHLLENRIDSASSRAIASRGHFARAAVVALSGILRDYPVWDKEKKSAWSDKGVNSFFIVRSNMQTSSLCWIFRSGFHSARCKIICCNDLSFGVNGLSWTEKARLQRALYHFQLFASLKESYILNKRGRTKNTVILNLTWRNHTTSLISSPNTENLFTISWWKIRCHAVCLCFVNHSRWSAWRPARIKSIWQRMPSSVMKISIIPRWRNFQPILRRTGSLKNIVDFLMATFLANQTNHNMAWWRCSRLGRTLPWP